MAGRSEGRWRIRGPLVHRLRWMFALVAFLLVVVIDVDAARSARQPDPPVVCMPNGMICWFGAQPDTPDYRRELLERRLLVHGLLFVAVVAVAGAIAWRREPTRAGRRRIADDLGMAVFFYIPAAGGLAIALETSRAGYMVLVPAAAMVALAGAGRLATRVRGSAPGADGGRAAVAVRTEGGITYERLPLIGRQATRAWAVVGLIATAVWIGGLAVVGCDGKPEAIEAVAWLGGLLALGSGVACLVARNWFVALICFVGALSAPLWALHPALCLS